VDPNRPSTTTPSSVDIDQIRESERQTSIFRLYEEGSAADTAPESSGSGVDFTRLRDALIGEGQIPAAAVDTALRHVRVHLEHLGLERPAPALIAHWLTGLLREQGFSLGEISLQSLELTLGDVAVNILHPVGTGAASSQNPEATSQLIARRIKAQFATRRVYQDEVIAAHAEGRLELLYLGAIDRPHDIFLTPDYLKHHGLPDVIGAPGTGAARRADVLLSHLIRFTHELQNHFAGHVRWGYLNTLLLPFLDTMSERELAQFTQQMLFEFAQLDIERAGMPRKVILDLDLDIPRQLRGLPIVGPGGKSGTRPYGAYGRTLRQLNEIVLDILERGDARRNPFHSPQIVFHLNDPDLPWTSLHQQLFATAHKHGNPTVAFSWRRRDFGPLGMLSLNDPDFLKLVQSPAELRGFSSSTIALNLPRLVDPERENGFRAELDAVMDFAVSAHRQKRLFISRLMAYGSRGPLQFLRHKLGNRPFLKIDSATQPMQLIGLGEAAAIYNGSPTSRPDAMGEKAAEILSGLRQAVSANNKLHKLAMHLSATRSEDVAYRFALLDLRRTGQRLVPYLLRRPDQSHPIYTEGANILAFANLSWRERMRTEAALHEQFDGFHQHTVFLERGRVEDPTLLQMLYSEARDAGISQLMLAPDLQLCMTCYQIGEPGPEQCINCNGQMVVPYGYCQANFSPVHTWCLGKRAEWKLRRHLDDYHLPVQTQLEF